MSDFGWPSPIASYYRMQRRTPKVVDNRKKRLRVTDKHVRIINIIIVTIPTIICDHHHYHNRRRIASSVYDCLILFSFIVTLFASYEETDGATFASTVVFFHFLSSLCDCCYCCACRHCCCCFCCCSWTVSFLVCPRSDFSISLLFCRCSTIRDGSSNSNQPKTKAKNGRSYHWVTQSDGPSEQRSAGKSAESFHEAKNERKGRPADHSSSMRQ